MIFASWVFIVCQLLNLATVLAVQNYVATVFEEAYVGSFVNLGSLRLFLYDVPRGTQQTAWCFSARNKPKNTKCPISEVIVNVQYGSIPTVNYIGAETYPEYITVRSDQVTNLTVLSGSSACLQISNPVSGTWFAAAYRSEKQQDKAVTKITSVDCSYFIQANAKSFVADSIQEIGTGTPFSVTINPNLSTFSYLLSGNARAYAVSVSCFEPLSESKEVIPCPLLLTARAGGLPLNFSSGDHDQQVSVNCSDLKRCVLDFLSPNVDVHHYLNVYNVIATPLKLVITVQTSVCQSRLNCTANDPECGKAEKSVAVIHNASYPVPGSTLRITLPQQDAIVVGVVNDTAAKSIHVDAKPTAVTKKSKQCTDSLVEMIRQEDPVIAFDSSSSLVFEFVDSTTFISRFGVDQFKDTGGTLSVTARLYTQSQVQTVNVCVQSGSVPSSRSSQLVCNSASQSSVLNARNSTMVKTFLYPTPGPWFIGFQANCTNGTFGEILRCNATMFMAIEVEISSCADSSCQNGGQCRSYTRGVYSYTACYCIAGYRGFTCEDDSEAKSLQTQIMYTVFLTISNFAFVPAIIYACYRRYFFEAVVYLANMFFSTFYHWCDMTTWSKYTVCIAPYSSLQFCDFLCSLLSFWITLLVVAKIPSRVRYFLFILGVFALILPVNINSTGLITNVVPIVVGLLIVIGSWVRVCVMERQCYPPRKSWLFLACGFALALVGISLFALVETDANYPFTHSAWHACMAFCIVFFLMAIMSGKKDMIASDDSTVHNEQPHLISHHLGLVDEEVGAGATGDPKCRESGGCDLAQGGESDGLEMAEDVSMMALYKGGQLAFQEVDGTIAEVATAFEMDGTELHTDRSLLVKVQPVDIEKP